MESNLVNHPVLEEKQVFDREEAEYNTFIAEKLRNYADRIEKGEQIAGTFVGIDVDSQNIHEMIFKVRHPGDLFGLIGMLDHAKASLLTYCDEMLRPAAQGNDDDPAGS